MFPSVIRLKNVGDKLAVAITRLRFWAMVVVFKTSRRASLAGLLESWTVTSLARETMVPRAAA